MSQKITTADEAAEVVTLATPIPVGAEKVTTLYFRRPNLGDMRATDGQGEFARLAILAARLTGLPLTSVERIDGADLDKVAEVVGNFLSRSPATGAS